MKAAIFTGSRNWKDWKLISKIILKNKYDIIIHGDCPTGADYIVDKIGRLFGKTIIKMPAQWDKYGKQAGPARNKEMLNLLFCLQRCGYDIYIEAFPLRDSKGTYNMIKIARQAGMTVNPHYID